MTATTTTALSSHEQSEAPATRAPQAPPPAQATPEHTLALPRLIDWLQSELPFPRFGTSVHERELRCERYVDDGRFLLRVELSGIDPSKDVEITVADGVLRVHAERHESRKDAHHSEFFYGTLVRTFLLPHGVDENAVAATYRDGVLEVTAPLPPHADRPGRKVPVTRSAS
jgi:HSP20 family protein